MIRGTMICGSYFGHFSIRHPDHFFHGESVIHNADHFLGHDPRSQTKSDSQLCKSQPSNSEKRCFLPLSPFTNDFFKKLSIKSTRDL